MKGCFTRSLWRDADTVLRGRALHRESAVPLPSIVLLSILAGAFYGATMGTFGAGASPNLQVVFSAIKVPLLPVVSFALGLPTLFIAATLFGLRDDFMPALRALLAAAAGQALLLAALAPLTILCYLSTRDYRTALLFNVLVFGCAAVGGGILVQRYFRPLIARDKRHKQLLVLWLTLSAFSGVQTAWMLRPFVGSPDLAPAFVRTEGWSNAYEQLWYIIVRK
jgi:hypothetical protein